MLAALFSGEVAMLRRLVLVRHGETLGRSSERFHGRSDVALAPEGREQMIAARAALRREAFDIVAASPLQRSFAAARALAPGVPIWIASELREIDFGRWEGLTKAEIEARDPVLYRDWQARRAGFEYPGGERRAAFNARVMRGFERLEATGVPCALAVLHKGVIRSLVEQLCGAVLESSEPALGALVGLSRDASNRWLLGRRGSDPAGLENRAA
jgi:broad specificity phosphatase PhoE